jgi:hypothetical protein
MDNDVHIHALMSYRGQPNWPPSWMWVGPGENHYPHGEVGVLKEVHISVLDPLKPDSKRPYNRVYLFMEYRDCRYIGCLLFDDPAGCREIGKILSQYCGRSLKEIGQIDLAHLL